MSTTSLKAVADSTNNPAKINQDIIATKHGDSMSRYPDLSLSADEYVIQSVKRHPIGLVSIWLVAGIPILIALTMLPVYALNYTSILSQFGLGTTALPTAANLIIPILLICGFLILGGAIATIVYEGNHFYLTNESVIQHVRPSLFHTETQIINLVNVEDVSFDKQGIIPQLLNYGTIRLSTQGQETIYHFYYVSNPNQVVNAVNDAIEVAMRNLEGDLRMHQVRE